ncbi:hypothetical protein F2Q69_00034459 [Brassica cretica]|uniref:Uncharacterized protein n=2 Tax=Brassica cretica TaxID=69181 RepID=A0A8S9SF81_BRACR|nr:hypothetical protein DY000_02038992 [Brassica cretica]KAF3599978.1 hypothetical protein F2Q69_00034459 [Brassica cretica]
MLMEKKVKEWIEEMEVKRQSNQTWPTCSSFQGMKSLEHKVGHESPLKMATKSKKSGRTRTSLAIGSFKRHQLKVMVEQSRILPCYTRRP